MACLIVAKKSVLWSGEFYTLTRVSSPPREKRVKVQEGKSEARGVIKGSCSLYYAHPCSFASLSAIF